MNMPFRNRLLVGDLGYSRRITKSLIKAMPIRVVATTYH
jgi:hypothetical protein